MKRIIAGVFSALLVAACFTLASPASPAHAGSNCVEPFCGRIIHVNDTGYDPAILIRCDYGDPSTNHLLYEIRSSKRFCKDTDQVYVRPGEELHCRMPYNTAHGVGMRWQKTFDATGWHQIHNEFRWDCVLQKD